MAVLYLFSPFSVTSVMLIIGIIIMRSQVRGGEYSHGPLDETLLVMKMSSVISCRSSTNVFTQHLQQELKKTATKINYIK